VKRIVVDQVDGNGIYCSRLAAGGPFVFMAGVSVDESGAFADDAVVPAPYHLSPSAQVRYQTQSIWDRYRRGLEQLGSSCSDVVQVEQYISRKAHADGYLEVSRGPGFMERGRPGSALIATGDFAPYQCVVNPTGIAVIPQEGYKKAIGGTGEQDPGKRPEFGDAYAEEPVYNEIVTAGDYVFTVGDWSSDYATGIRSDVKADDWIWWGNEARNETNFILKTLATRLENARTSLANTVHCTVFLVDLADLYEVDLVWKKFFPTDPPARTVIPIRGLGTPRAEGPSTHAEGAMKMESMFQSVRLSNKTSRDIVSTGATILGHESEAIRAGHLLWTSSLIAGNESGLVTSPDIQSQLTYLFARLRDICEAGKTSLDNLLRLRAYVTNPEDSYAIYAQLKQAVPSDPPAVCITSVPAPLQVPNATVMLDGVVFVP